MVIEQKISELEVKYKQKRQKLEQQKSVLAIKDMLHIGRKHLIMWQGNCMCLVSTGAVQTIDQMYVPRQKCTQLVKPGIII